MSIRFRAVVLAAVLAFTAAGCATGSGRDIEQILVDQVDLRRYSGLWYQVGRYPNWFQTGDCEESTAEYTLYEDGTVSVLNRCWSDRYGGTYSQQVRAVARPANAGNSWLRVRFFGLFPANYLIIELDAEHYQWAAVTTPGRSSLWILSRTPALESETFEQIVASLENKGFDPDKISRTSRQQ
jgi:apolipoprotein D and lipocalin family protein